MTELSRNLLAAAREGLAPDPAVAARVRAKVAAAVGGTAVVAPTAKATAKASAFKIGGAALVVGIVVAALIAVPGSERAVAPHVTTPSAELDVPRVSEHVAVAEPQVAPPIPAPVIEFHGTAPRASLAREVELIDRAMLALRQDKPAAALEAITTFDRETQRRGQMAEDAAAIALEAHCKLGHDVSIVLSVFDRTYPSSAQRARVREACGR